MGPVLMEGIYKSSIDVERIMENYPKTIPTEYILTNKYEVAINGIEIKQTCILRTYIAKS